MQGNAVPLLQCGRDVVDAEYFPFTGIQEAEQQRAVRTLHRGKLMPLFVVHLAASGNAVGTGHQHLHNGVFFGDRGHGKIGLGTARED